jgi:hypothetical protein
MRRADVASKDCGAVSFSVSASSIDDEKAQFDGNNLNLTTILSCGRSHLGLGEYPKNTERQKKKVKLNFITHFPPYLYPTRDAV